MFQCQPSLFGPVNRWSQHLWFNQCWGWELSHVNLIQRKEILGLFKISISCRTNKFFLHSWLSGGHPSSQYWWWVTSLDRRHKTQIKDEWTRCCCRPDTLYQRVSVIFCVYCGCAKHSAGIIYKMSHWHFSCYKWKSQFAETVLSQYA